MVHTVAGSATSFCMALYLMLSSMTHRTAWQLDQDSVLFYTPKFYIGPLTVALLLSAVFCGDTAPWL